MSEELIKRRDATVEVGLTASEVEERKQAGLINRKISIKNKKVVSVLLGNFLNVHNIIAVLILALLISSNYWYGLFFLIPLSIDLIFKTLILLNSIHHEKDKTQTDFHVVRDGVIKTVKSNEIVLDDVVVLNEKDAVPMDGTIKEGQVMVDESSLFGLSNPHLKKPGDKVYYGTFVISGKCFVKCEQTTKDTFKAGLASSMHKRKTSKLNIASLVASILVGVSALFVLISYLILFGKNGGFSSFDSYKETGQNVVGITLTVVPFGMFAMISLTLFISLMRTKKLNARVQNLTALETLTHIDTICFDKTGILTSEDFEVKKVLLYGTGYTNDDIEQIISNLLETNKDNDLIAQALHRSFNYSLTKRIVTPLPYNEINKYAGATFAGGETYAIGYPMFLNIINRSALNHRVEEYLRQGCDVVVLARCKNAVTNNSIPGEMTPIALIVLQKKLRKNLSSLISELKEENINIKILSGDDPQAVIQVATECGVENNYKFISLKDMSKEDVEKAALEYDVFGFASAEQKQIIIETLQRNKRKVAMVGNGDNDTLAFKVCDVAICSEKGSKIAKTCADIFIKDDELECLPKLINEGRKATYNIQRIASLFLTRAMFGFILAVAFFITSLTIGLHYPFKPAHFYLLGIVVTSIGGLLLCFDNPKRPPVLSSGSMILGKTISGALILSLPILVYSGLLLMQQNLIFYTGIYSYETMLNLSIMTISILGIAVLFKCYTRFKLCSLIAFIITTVLFVGLATAAVIISYKVGVAQSMLEIDFPSLTLVNYFVFGLVIIVIASFYLLLSYIIEIFRGEHLHVKNKS